MRKIDYAVSELKTYTVEFVLRDSDGYLVREKVSVIAHTGKEAESLAIGDWMVHDYFGLGFWTVDSVSYEIDPVTYENIEEVK